MNGAFENTTFRIIRFHLCHVEAASEPVVCRVLALASAAMTSVRGARENQAGPPQPDNIHEALSNRFQAAELQLITSISN